MKYNSDQVINGIIMYADNEVIGMLPTSGKWIMGTAIGLASNKAANMVEVLKDNAIVKMLDIVDNDGMIDVDTLISAMKNAADKYGKLTVDVPMIGKLTFNSSDIDRLKSYIG